MRLYFYGPPTGQQRLEETYGLIRRILKQSEVELSSNTQKPEADLGSEATETAAQRGGSLLDLMDGLIIEGSTEDSEVGYLLAYAIAQKKPTLFLSERGSRGRQILRYLNERQIPKTCLIRYYTATNLVWLLAEFLKTIDQSEVREIHRIKFTLRITPTIEEFLEWKTRNTKVKKADFLRQEVERLIDQDHDFLEYIKRKRRNQSLSGQ